MVGGLLVLSVGSPPGAASRVCRQGALLCACTRPDSGLPHPQHTQLPGPPLRMPPPTRVDKCRSGPAPPPRPSGQPLRWVQDGGGGLAASEDGASCRPSLPLFVLFAREDDPQPLLPTSGTGPLSLTPCSSRDQSVTLAPFPPLRLWGQMKPPWEMAQGCLLRPAPSHPSRGALYTCCQGAWEQPAWTPMA